MRLTQQIEKNILRSTVRKFCHWLLSKFKSNFVNYKFSKHCLFAAQYWKDEYSAHWDGDKLWLCVTCSIEWCIIRSTYTHKCDTTQQETAKMYFRRRIEIRFAVLCCICTMCCVWLYVTHTEIISPSQRAAFSSFGY